MLILPAGSEDYVTVLLGACNGVKGKRLCSGVLDAASSNDIQSDGILCLDATASTDCCGVNGKRLGPEDSVASDAQGRHMIFINLWYQYR